jgi:predicted ATPase/DNA-binding XRE family transcriptional regulator
MQEEISFGVWLRKQRRALDLSRQAFANQIGCAEVTLRRIEAGTLKPSKELANILLDKLGIPNTERSQWISFARGLSDFPSQSHQSSNKPITNLPAPLTTFIGREKEQSEVVGLIAKHRLVTLTGSGGVGKTRLSIRVGEQVLGNYPAGVWLVELAPILDPLLVPRITAIAIGLRDEPQRPVIDMLSDYLHEKQILIILDNCEHLLDSCSQLVDTLLKRCPSLEILATSREALGMLGEAVYHVPSLELPDIDQLLEKFREYESVRLFEERAQLVQVNFSLTIENAPSVAKICNRLDGIPLAIELTAARISMFSTQQIAVRLQESFDILTIGNRTALPRHQTLRATIDWSYDLLSPVEKSVFQRLSVFVNGWTLEAAESICSDANIDPKAILDVLTQLYNKSLVVCEQTQSKIRYRMLETIRQYARQKVAQLGESEILRDKHLEYFLNLTETASPYLIKPEQLEWLAQLEADYENIRTALKRASSIDSPVSSLRLCAALGPFWTIRSHFLEGSEWLRIALSKPSENLEAIEKIARVRALYHDAHLAQELDDIERMKASAKLSLSLAQDSADRRDIAIARLYTGISLHAENKSDEACILIEQSLVEFRELKDCYWEAYTFRQLGYLLIMQGKIKWGASYLQALELARKAGERLNLADALLDYSKLVFSTYQIDETMKCVKEADTLYKQINSRMSLTSSALAAIAWLNGDPQKAKLLYIEVQERFGVLGAKYLRSTVIENLGRIALDDGKLEQAQAYFEEAIATARELELPFSIAFRLALISSIFYLKGNIAKYKQCLREGVASAKTLSSKASIVLFLNYALSSLSLQEPVSSANILGVIYTAEREHGSSIIGPLEKHYYNHAESYSREKLGNSAFEAAFAKGQKMSLDEGLDLALKTVEEM